MDAFWHFAKQMLRWRTHLIFGLLFAVVSAGGMGAGILAMQPVLDTILEPGHRGLPQLAEEYANEGWAQGLLTEDFIAALPEGPFDAVMWIMITLGVLTIFGAFANFMHQYLALTVVQRSIAMIRRRAFGQVIHLPLKTIVAEGPTEAISRIVNDTEALSAGYVALLSKAVAQITKGIIALVVALVTNWQLAIVALLLMPFLAVVIRKLGKRIRRASERALSSRAGLYRAATESLQGMRVVKVHTTERYEAGRFGRINKDVLHQQLRIRTARAIAGPLIETITVFTLGALTLVAVKLILDGHLDKSEFMTVLVALAIAGASIKPITGLVNDIQQSGAAADRLQRLLNEDAEPGHDIRMPKLPRHSESLVFNKVSFLYPGGSSRAVADVSLKIRAGETVAFVGPNGCGKTTLLSLVPRLFDPNDGQVLVDGIDITRIRVRSLRRQIGVVTQEVVLFKGTIRDNIAYGNINASDEQIRQAADRARATQFINQFDDGFETHVGEQGLTLSGGQRQRIAIARAILRDPAILILDEATSMVDAESERLIGEVLSTFCTNRTTLIVAHRLSTVLGADRIVVMDQGSIVATGTHEELLESCKLYQSLAQHQLISNDESTH
jgi:ATP-binding cassette, subfamily B, bacterial MsbA|tara:strand:+ start:147727 stop:149565 length:1839 start_codon:yes stop_codon:yes gene_type:complete